MRQLWFESHLLSDEAGKRARQRAIALGPRVHDHILSIGDRLAGESATLAQRFYCEAADAHTAFGPEFERWLAIGERLITAEPTVREGATAYFSIPATVAEAVGLDRLGHWVEIGLTIARASRKQAGLFYETTAPLLSSLTGEAPALTLDRLEAWATVAVRLHTQHGWQGEFLAQAFLAAAPHALLVLSGEQYSLWAGLGASLRRVVKESEFYAQLPSGVRRWSDPDRACFLRCCLSLAAVAQKPALRFYREAPRALRPLPAARRSQLLRVLQTTGKALASTIEDLVPVLGAVVLDVPASARETALDLAQRVADNFPYGVAPLLRSLPKTFEEADPSRVADWIDRGLALAADNTDAGLAFFALESRTSLKVLRAGSTGVAIEEVQGVLRKLIQMLSATPASLRSADGGVSLRPPLEEFPNENEVALPLRVDTLPTHEENVRIYRALAACVAGRREFGTYAFRAPDVLAPTADDEPDGAALVAYLHDEKRPELVEQLFLVADGYRVACRVTAEYPGLGAELRWVAGRLLARWSQLDAQSLGAVTVLDATLALAVSSSTDLEQEIGSLAWLDTAAPVILPCLAPLSSPTATVNDALRVAEALTARLLDLNAPRRIRQDQFEYGGLMLDRLTGETLMDVYDDDDSQLPADQQAPRVPAAGMPEGEAEIPDDLRLQLDQSPDDSPAGAQPLSLDDLRRLLQQGNLQIKQGTGEDTDGIGLYITDLVGKIPSAQLEELRQLLGDTDRATSGVRRWLEDRVDGPSFLYDEWDYHISDYRSRWCRLREIGVEGDGGEFFNNALTEYAAMIPGIRQQFQRIRPEMYRVVRGLEDGEDFDLNAAVDAHVERRARRSPSSKLYVARKREERDVATLFLLDMSASTDEPLEPVPKAARDDDDAWPMMAKGRRPAAAKGRRIIDVTKEALVIMAEALEEIGDAYAIYGFSGQGRDNVEFYLVKSFTEHLSSAVKGRIGGINPKRSTRMGTALRHSVEKMNAINSRSKHLILLSDGFPQDFDYGQDRRSNVYGIRDTAVALRETEAAGITPFCITVDRAGHDYLRQMCDESRYLVLDDIATLPRELPKVYQRLVRTR